MNKSCLILLIMCMGILGLWAQENLQINGLNEAQYIHRTASDSLNSYFRDSFSFNLALRNFRFGMKFIAELPKYSNNQDEVLDELDSSRLAYAWKELYAAYEKEDFLIQAGTISETFGNGIVFRAWEDLEFDEDNRIQGFLAKVAGEKGTIKALYGAYDSEGDPDKSDLSYGVDVQSTSWKGISLGATALSNRSYYSPYYDYNQRDAFGARMNLILGGLDANLEYAISKLYKFGAFGRDGEARYAQASYNFSTIQIGSAYKYYRDFDTRLQDLPMANYHNEPLSDFQSGEDEEGLQGWINWQPSDQFNLILDYA
ncbi:MAG: DUF6029 family protein, partial [Candidatus Cloacimonetes bacterium]|nr:DUF6029 family protein [Candidatus Cloacimonadota bacterium]